MSEDKTDRIYFEVGNQFLLVTGIMSGFAVSAVVQLLSLKDQRMVVTAALVAFIIATAALIISLCVFTIAQSLLIEKGLFDQSKQKHDTERMDGIAFISFLAGLCSFLIGVGISGWIQSLFVGIVSSVSAVVGIVIIGWAIKSWV